MGNVQMRTVALMNGSKFPRGNEWIMHEPIKGGTLGSDALLCHFRDSPIIRDLRRLEFRTERILVGRAMSDLRLQQRAMLNPLAPLRLLRGFVGTRGGTPASIARCSRRSVT